LNTNTNRYECGLQPRLEAEYMNDMKFVDGKSILKSGYEEG